MYRLEVRKISWRHKEHAGKNRASWVLFKKNTQFFYYFQNFRTEPQKHMPLKCHVAANVFSSGTKEKEKIQLETGFE